MACRCSRLSYKTKGGDECGQNPTSNGDSSGSDLRRNSSGRLGACRCSHLCYKSRTHFGCIAHPPNGNRRDGNGSGSVADNSDAGKGVNGSSRTASGGDLKENTSDSSGVCRCWHLCHLTESREGCVAEPPLSRSVNLKPCRCSAPCYKSTSHDGCMDHPADRPGTSGEPQSRVADEPRDPGCYCTTHEVPVKEPKGSRPYTAPLGECPCDGSAKTSVFSLDATDLRYLDQIRELTVQDHKLKHELDDLMAQEMAVRNTIKKCDQAAASGKIVGDSDLKMLRAMHKEFTSLNEGLTDKIQDLHLEQDQLAQKINGPLNRELERIRKKYADVRCEISRQRQSEQVDSDSEELQLLKAQLQRVQQSIADIALVNNGIKQEVAVLECKCDKMEQVLINQKLDEIDAINRLQTDKPEPENRQAEDCSAPSTNERTTTSGTPTCSCSED